MRSPLGNLFEMNQMNIHLIKIIIILLLLVWSCRKISEPTQIGSIYPDIVFSSNRSGGSDIYYLNNTEQTTISLTNTDTRNEFNPRFSLDGKFLIYTAVHSGGYQLFKLNLDSQRSKQLTRDYGVMNLYPSFARDNRNIIFETLQNGAWHIHRMDLNDSLSLRINLTSDTHHFMSPSYSPDNSQIVFTRHNKDWSNGEIGIMDSNGMNLQILAKGRDNGRTQPQFSPDGQKIVYVSDIDGNSEIYMIEKNGENRINLTNNLAYDSEPVFSPDGSKIAFVSKRSENFEIYLLSLEDNNLKRLTVNGYYNSQPRFSADGKTIIYLSGKDIYGEGYDIFAMDLEGKVRRNLTNYPNTNYAYTIKPN